MMRIFTLSYLSHELQKLCLKLLKEIKLAILQILYPPVLIKWLYVVMYGIHCG